MTPNFLASVLQLDLPLVFVFQPGDGRGVGFLNEQAHMKVKMLGRQHAFCRGIVTSYVLVIGLNCGAIATRKLEGVNRDKGDERFYTSPAPYGEGKAYV